MGIEEYFGDWWPTIDKKELELVLQKTKDVYSRSTCSPERKNIFKAFELCSRKACKVIFIGQDPYPQEGIATGLAFANSKDQKELSPSLKIIKNCILDLENPHNLRIFDPSLESIALQGVLLLNSSLSVEVNKINSHQLIWRRFIEQFLINLSTYETGLIYVLFGSQAQSFRPFIGKYNTLINCVHPSYCARTNTKLPDVFTEINKLLYNKYGETIKWYTTL